MNDTETLVCLGKLNVLLKKTPFPETPNPPNSLSFPHYVIKCLDEELVTQPLVLKWSAFDKTEITFVPCGPGGKTGGLTGIIGDV